MGFLRRKPVAKVAKVRREFSIRVPVGVRERLDAMGQRFTAQRSDGVVTVICDIAPDTPISWGVYWLGGLMENQTAPIEVYDIPADPPG